MHSRIESEDLDEFDESKIQLTEEDLHDSELLSEYQSLHNSAEEHFSVADFDNLLNNELDDPELLMEFNSLQKDVFDTDVNQNDEFSVMGITISTLTLTSDEAKTIALKFKQNGDTSKALEWMRIGKRVEIGEQLSANQIKLAASSSSASNNSGSKPNKISRRTDSIKSTKVNENSQNAMKKVVKSTAPIKKSPEISEPIQNNLSDPYSPLEDAIKVAAATALKKAKSFEFTDKKLAVEHMREYKRFQQELAVLNSRRLANAPPALFRWKTVTKEIINENIDVGEDQMKIVIEGLYSIESALEGESSRNINVVYTTNVLKDEKASTVGTATKVVKYENGKAEFHFEGLVSGIKRSKNVQLVQQIYNKKKVSFEIVLHRGILRGSKVIATAQLSLGELTNRCECGGNLTLSTQATEGKKGKLLGGTLRAYAKLRFPIFGTDKQIVEERELIIEQWPELNASSAFENIQKPVSSLNTSSIQPQPVTVKKETPSVAVSRDESDLPLANLLTNTLPTSYSTQSTTDHSQTKSKLPTGLNPAEIEDPHAVDWIESNDVLEMEINRSMELMKGGKLTEDEQFSETTRLELLQVKQQILILNVQQEKITMEEYLKIVKERIVKDKKKAAYLYSLKTPESTADALRILKRAKIMEEEVTGAENQSES